MRVAWILMVVLSAAGVWGGAPAVAAAAGFGPVRSLSPVHGNVDSPSAAVSPTGQVAVLWRRTGDRPADFRYLAVVGRDAEHLGRPVVVGSGLPAAPVNGDGILLARPDGGFVACFTAEPRHNVTAAGCSFAPPNGRFGRLRVVDRRPWSQRLNFKAVMRPDGQVVLVLRHRTGARQQLSSVTLGPSGMRGAPQSLVTLRNSTSFGLAATDDGTVAVTWADVAADDTSGLKIPSLRLMSPGEQRFGEPVPFTDDLVVTDGLKVQGGQQLRLSYLTRGSAENLAVVRLLNGSFSAPLHLPRPGTGLLDGLTVSLADGTPLAVVAAQRRADTDCADVTKSVVGTGPLAPTADQATSQQLSTPGQIAVDPIAASLADGTIIASWGNSLGPVGWTRIEVALRPSGAPAFLRPQVLPHFSVRETALVAHGDQAVLVWVVGSNQIGPSHVVASALRRSPPYVPSAPLPRRPHAPCE